MAHAHAAADIERLPWLTDDKAPSGKGERWLLLGWGMVATVLVAGTSFWLGMNGADLPDWRRILPASQPEATVKLPEPVTVAPAPRQADPMTPQVEPAMPEVEPLPEPAPVALPAQTQAKPAKSTAASQRKARADRRAIKARTVTSRDSNLRRVVSKQSARPKPKAPRVWTPWESRGASGRMVRIGTYRTRSEAKRAWTKLVKVYPGMKRLPAVTTDIPSLRNGRTYYRLQFGTTSQAHSEVLCQRMRTIGQSCVVVDLAGARERGVNDGQPVGL